MPFKKTVLLATAAATVIGFAAPAYAAWPQQSGARVPRPWRAQDVVDAIGVGTHLTYGGSAYSNPSAVIAALKYIGVTHVREGVPVSQPNDPRLAPYYDLLQAGFSLQLVAPPPSPGNEGYSSVMAAVSATVTRLVNAYPNKITGIEGLNEPDLQNDGYTFTYGSLSGAKAVAQYQLDLYSTLKSNPATASIPVWSYSLNSPPYNQMMYEAVFAANPAVTQAFDVANRGVYPGTWSPAYGMSGQLINSVDMGLSGTTYTSGPYAKDVNMKVLGTKELGLTSTPVQPNSSGMPDYETQAKILPSTLYDSLIFGSMHSFMYELADVFPDPKATNSQDHFGLFDNAMKPKPVATVLHNTLTKLADSSSNAKLFTPQQLNVSIYQFPEQVAGAAPSGYTLIMQRSNGDYQILVWYEPLVWNLETSKPYPAIAPRSITMFLSQACATSSIYDPQSDVTTAGPKKSGAIPVSLPDHPVLVTCTAH